LLGSDGGSVGGDGVRSLRDDRLDFAGSPGREVVCLGLGAGLGVREQSTLLSELILGSRQGSTERCSEVVSSTETVRGCRADARKVNSLGARLQLDLGLSSSIASELFRGTEVVGRILGKQVFITEQTTFLTCRRRRMSAAGNGVARRSGRATKGREGAGRS